MQLRSLLVAVTAGLVLLSGCGEVSSPSVVGRPAYQTQLWCETHPVECGTEQDPDLPVDPDTAAPGYWLGTTVTDDRCFSTSGAGINDRDHDALDDYCEETLAQLFRPVFHLAPANYECDSDMEPYWAAKYFPAQGNVVRIFYALPYYRDCGSSNPLGGPAQFFGRIFTLNGLLPNYSVGPLPVSTSNENDGHAGDSEFLVVSVTFDPASQHWRSDKVFYSAHYKTSADGSSNAFRIGNPKIEFGDRSGGYPLVWVAAGKHANYPSKSKCNANRAPLVADNCNANFRDVRMPFQGLHNLGSVHHNFINTYSCVRSELQPAFKPGTECFWKPGDYFDGWLQYPYGAPPTPYYTELVMKFECYSDFNYFVFLGIEYVECSDWGPILP